MISTLDKYLARLIVAPTLAVMGITIVLLLLDNMLRLLHSILDAGAPLRVVFSLLLYVVPEYVALGLPISLLFGVMVAFRRLALDNELQVIQFGQLSPLRMMRVPIIAGGLFAVLNSAMVGFIQPYSEYAYRELGYEARLGIFGRTIRTGKLVQLSPAVTFMANKIERNNGNLDGIFMHIRQQDGAEFVTTAKSGTFLRGDAEDMLVLRLLDGQIATAGIKDISRPGIMTFQRYDMKIPLPRPGVVAARGSALNEMTLPELLLRQADPKVGPMERRRASSESQKRIILMLLPLLIPFLAAAVAPPPPRHADAIGIVVGLGILILEFKTLDFGTYVSSIPGGLVLWPAFFGLVALTARLFFIFGFIPGLHPLAGLYSLAEKIPRLRPKLLS